MLGMIIGVAAVMTMVALGNGAGQSVEQDVRSAGTNLVHVSAGNYTRGGEESRIATGLGSATTLTPADADAIGRSVPGIKAYAPGVRLRGWMTSGAHRYYGQIVGTDVPFASMYGWRFDEGRWLTRDDVNARRPVVVLGRTTRDQIFGSGAKATGQSIAIHGRTFAVVGITDTADPDQIEMAFVPYPALQDALGIAYLRASAPLTALLAGIAAISLVVGGVGIMNIMLVAVKERTREIGVRRAVGARRRDVLLQFLAEALTLSAVGGAIGIALGFAAAFALTVLLDWPTRTSAGAVALAFGISAAIGIFFGFYPARRASRLDPIDALRTE